MTEQIIHGLSGLKARVDSDGLTLRTTDSGVSPSPVQAEDGRIYTITAASTGLPFTSTDTAASGAIDTAGCDEVVWQDVTVSGNQADRITPQVSNDGTQWVNASYESLLGVGASTEGGGTYVPDVTQARRCNPGLRYFRLLAGTLNAATTTKVVTRRSPGRSAVEQGQGNTSAPWTVQGRAAEGVAVAGNPVPPGLEARTTNKTAVTNGQVVRPIGTTVGVAVQKPFSVPELDWIYAPPANGISNSNAAVNIVNAAGSGLRNYITGVQISHGNINAATELVLRDNTNGNVIARIGLNAGVLTVPVSLTFKTPLKSVANAPVEVLTLTAVTGNIYVNAQGYIAP